MKHAKLLGNRLQVTTLSLCFLVLCPSLREMTKQNGETGRQTELRKEKRLGEKKGIT